MQLAAVRGTTWAVWGMCSLEGPPGLMCAICAASCYGGAVVCCNPVSGGPKGDAGTLVPLVTLVMGIHPDLAHCPFVAGD